MRSNSEEIWSRNACAAWPIAFDPPLRAYNRLYTRPWPYTAEKRMNVWGRLFADQSNWLSQVMCPLVGIEVKLECDGSSRYRIRNRQGWSCVKKQCLFLLCCYYSSSFLSYRKANPDDLGWLGRQKLKKGKNIRKNNLNIMLKSRLESRLWINSVFRLAPFRFAVIIILIFNFYYQ